MTRICLIGFGEVGQILAEDLAAGGAAELPAHTETDLGAMLDHINRKTA